MEHSLNKTRRKEELFSTIDKPCVELLLAMITYWNLYPEIKEIQA